MHTPRRRAAAPRRASRDLSSKAHHYHRQQEQQQQEQCPQQQQQHQQQQPLCAFPPLQHVLQAYDVAFALASPAAPTGKTTPFHSSVVPPLALSQFAHRIAYYSGYGVEELCVGLALMARYARATGIAPTRLMLHRLVLSCIAVGAKVCCDHFIKSVYVARIGGVPVEELNYLEAQLLDDLAFSALPTLAECRGIVPALLALTPAANDVLRDKSGTTCGSELLLDALRTNAAPADSAQFAPLEPPAPLPVAPEPRTEQVPSAFAAGEMPVFAKRGGGGSTSRCESAASGFEGRTPANASSWSFAMGDPCSTTHATERYVDPCGLTSPRGNESFATASP